jgi:hypothetical protein
VRINREQANFSIMTKFIDDPANLKIMMNMLRVGVLPCSILFRFAAVNNVHKRVP